MSSHSHHHDMHVMTSTTMSNMSTSTGFCQGDMGGMIMYMDGFHFGLYGNNQPCLNLYFTSWTLDSRTKFVAAIIGVFFLAILVEGSSKARHIMMKQSQKCLLLLRQSNHHHHDTTTATKEVMFWRICLPSMHAFQALLGYMLMLAMMTFSIELLFAVVLGLGVGYAIFFQDYFDVLHVTSNPCCQFLHEEAREDDLILTGSAVDHGQCCDQATDPLLSHAVQASTNDSLNNL